MTKREFFEKVIALCASNEEIVDFAKNEITHIDTKNERAKADRIAKQTEDNPIIAKIEEYLTNHHYALASELSQVCEVSTSKITAVAKRMPNVNAEKVKIPKVGERTRYSLIQ